MANWQAVQQGLLGGMQAGMQTGGRLAGLGSVISKVADQLRSERQQKEALSLLGQTEGIKAQYSPKEWKPQTREEAIDFEKAKRNIDYEDIPSGFVSIGGKVYRDPSYRPESPQNEKAQLDLEDRKRVNKAKSDSVIQSANDTLNTIKEVEKRMDAFGALGNVPTVPGFYSRRNWESNIDKLKSKLILDVITNMKEASKTGATGFGQLNLQELEVLKNASTALKKDLSPQDAQRYLNEMKIVAEKVVKGSSSGEQSLKNPGKQKDFSEMSDDELRAIANGQ